MNNNRNKEKINVLLFAKSLDGGTGTFVTQFLDKSSRHKTITVKTIVLEKPQYRAITSNTVGFFPWNGNYPEKYPLLTYYLTQSIKEIRWLKKCIREYQPDIIVSIDAHCIILSYITCLLSREKSYQIASIHNNIFEVVKMKSPPVLYGCIHKLLSLSLHGADSVVCISKKLSEDVHRRYSLKKIPSTIYCGIHHSKKPVFFKKQPNIVVAVMRLVEQKDPDTLIRAFARILSRVPRAKLWIIGDGNMRQHVQRLISRLDINGSVRLFGWVHNPTKFVERSDIFVLSSKREGFGYALLEAMSRGKPVITTDSPFGPSEIVDNGKYGLLVPVGDTRSMEKAIDALFHNSKKYVYFAQKAYERSMYFSFDKMFHRYMQLFTRFCSSECKSSRGSKSVARKD